jgi:hypothetical protein
VFSPHAKRGERLFWEGDRFWMTINEMQMEVKQERFSKDAVDMVRNSAMNNGMSDIDLIIAQKSKPVECFYWYGRLPFNQNNEIDLSGQDTIEQEVICIVAYHEEELLDMMSWPHRRLPYPDRVYLRGEFEESEGFDGRSLVQKLYMTQKELNTLHNTIMNNAMIAMQKIFVKRRSLSGDGYERPSIYPGAMWEEDIPGEIRALEVGDVKNIGMELEQTLLSFAERVSNVSIFQTGANRSEGGQKTLGEIQKTIHEANIGLDKYIQNCHRTLRKICTWTVDYYADRMPEGLERRIRGVDSEPIFPTSQNMAMYRQKGINPTWQEDDLVGKFDFIWNGGSLNSSKEYKLAVANDLMDRYLPHPMIAGSLLATWEILKKGLIARGEKDWQSVLPKRESILAEMQKMEQQSKIKKVMQVVEERKANAGLIPQTARG